MNRKILLAVAAASFVLAIASYVNHPELLPWYEPHRDTGHWVLQNRDGQVFEYDALSNLGRGQNHTEVAVGQFLDVVISTDTPAAEVRPDVHATLASDGATDPSALVQTRDGTKPQEQEWLGGAVSIFRWSTVQPGVALIEFRDGQDKLVGTLRVTVKADLPAELR